MRAGASLERLVRLCFGMLLLFLMLGAGCTQDSGDDDASQAGDDDGTASGDDDATGGDDDATHPGDDDASGDDDATRTGDDDVTTAGDDDATHTGDDDVTTAGDDDATHTGDDDVTTGGDDDATHPGDDDASGDDDATVSGDDDASHPGDDDSSPAGDDDASVPPSDRDHDGIPDSSDSCPDDPLNDVDQDGVCGSVDDCPDVADDQTDSDKDGLGNACDPCPFDPDDDLDDDGVCGDLDNCEDVPNIDQNDFDLDGVGDACDPCPRDSANDADQDGVCESLDNCPLSANKDQADGDADGQGDACDACPKDAANDVDKDGVCGDVDNCPTTSNANQADSDKDKLGDACDACPKDAFNDVDKDGICGNVDNCPTSANGTQMDRDGDSKGDACDPCPDDNPDDPDGDGQCGAVGSTPYPNATFSIVAAYPSDSALAIPVSLVPRLDFSEAYAGSISAVHGTLVSQSGARTTLTPNLSSSKTWLYFSQVSLASDTDYCLTVSIDHQDAVHAAWPLKSTYCFTTEVPCGVSFDVGVHVVVKNFGGTKAAVTYMNSLLQTNGDSYPVILMFPDVGASSPFPMSDFWLALGSYAYGPPATLDPKGLSSSMYGCAISSGGAFTCGPDDVTFPIDVGSGPTYVQILNSTMAATAIKSGSLNDLDNYVIKGVITQQEISYFATAMGAPDAAGLVVLNVDLNKDGKNDAATVELNSSPDPLTIQGCDPSKL